MVPKKPTLHASNIMFTQRAGLQSQMISPLYGPGPWLVPIPGKDKMRSYNLVRRRQRRGGSLLLAVSVTIALFTMMWMMVAAVKPLSIWFK